MMLLNHAQITTIDSFCLYLLRNHFHSICLDPSFRIADENEMKLLKEDVLEELMDDYIREAKEIFISFTEQFTNGWNLTPAKERILQVYEFSQSHPFPTDWLQSCRDEIANRSKESLYETEWMRFLETYECNVYQECVGLLGEALTICALPDGPAQYREALEEDLTFCRELAETKEYAKRSAMLGAYSFTRLSTKRNPDASEENKEGVKAIRENVKELLGEVQRILYFADETTIQSDYLVSGETLQFLLGTVLDFTMRLEQKKKEKNLIDFTDMEHKALQILLQKEGDDYVPSEVAVSYQEFFEEIMVDEYQDSNYLNLLIYVLVHTNYVVPVHLDESVREKVENIAQLKDKSVLRFPSLQNHNDPNLRVFPVFTDSVALDNWKTIFNEEHPKYTMLLKFNEILQICNKTGIVINPFGPVPIPLTPEQIQQIVNLEGYKSEFGEVSQVKTPEEPAKQEAKLMIGVPKETEEIRLMKEAIIAHAKTVREIQRVDFLLKVDAQKERAYLCIVDCPKEDAAKFFTGIHKAAAPYLNEVKRLEFLLFGKTKLASDVANEKSCIYEA